jgi:hypothetical protein
VNAQRGENGGGGEAAPEEPHMGVARNCHPLSVCRCRSAAKTLCCHTLNRSLPALWPRSKARAYLVPFCPSRLPPPQAARAHARVHVHALYSSTAPPNLTPACASSDTPGHTWRNPQHVDRRVRILQAAARRQRTRRGPLAPWSSPAILRAGCRTAEEQARRSLGPERATICTCMRTRAAGAARDVPGAA